MSRYGFGFICGAEHRIRVFKHRRDPNLYPDKFIELLDMIGKKI